MMDLNSTLAPEMYMVLRDLRELEAGKLEWNRRLRALREADRREQADAKRPTGPATMAGC